MLVFQPSLETYHYAERKKTFSGPITNGSEKLKIKASAKITTHVVTPAGEYSAFRHLLDIRHIPPHRISLYLDLGRRPVEDGVDDLEDKICRVLTHHEEARVSGIRVWAVQKEKVWDYVWGQ